MSAKPSTSKNKKPETVLTRNKSAQMKRQLREKDRSMKTITCLLKSPPRNGKKKAGRKRIYPLPTPLVIDETLKVTKGSKSYASPKQVQKEPTPKEVASDEYYPNKLKRSIKISKVLLKPKHDLVKIGVTNKRKRCTPQRGLKSPVPSKKKRTIETEPVPIEQKVEIPKQPSIDELIQMTELDYLTDEDLKEILTCPSPVWWEDPPDECFLEDAVGTLKEVLVPVKTEKDNIETEANINEKEINLNPTDVNIEKRGCTFMKKRSKLENLLGSIKNKNGIRSNESPIENNDSELNVEAKNDAKKVDSDKQIDNNEETDKRTDSRRKCNSESSEGDLFNEVSDDVLASLENIKIPIEDKSLSKISDDSILDKEEPSSSSNPSSNFLASGKDTHDMDPKSNDRNFHNDDSHFKIVLIEREEDAKLKDLKNNSADEDLIVGDDKIPKDLPRLTRCPSNFKVGASSLDSSSLNSSQDMEYMPDKIHFLTDDDSTNDKSENTGNDTDFCVNKAFGCESDCANKVDKVDKKYIHYNENGTDIIGDSDFITVYKILETENDNDKKLCNYETGKKVNETLDSSNGIVKFFKDRKNAIRKKLAINKDNVKLNINSKNDVQEKDCIVISSSQTSLGCKECFLNNNCISCTTVDNLNADKS